ncbi:UDP-glucosyltransferase 2 [Plutella xylostella]|uniref:UDP-glucosyltransferase 2 n=1 Tax=Plutella xylostella TaxID=51655 RepID=UPI002032D7AB|nr:UDP-glucosyltransferase 2 [Plutella xylostella]
MTPITKLLLLCVFTCIVSVSSGARILCVYPVPFHSHQAVFNALSEALARAGHQVVALTPLPHPAPPPGLTQIDVHQLSYRLWEEGYKKFQHDNGGFGVDFITTWTQLSPVLHKIVESQIETPEMQAIIKDPKQHFDVILVEAVIPLSIMVAARFKAPVIQVSSFFGGNDNFMAMGVPVHPIIFPEFGARKTWKFSFWDKISSVYDFIRMRRFESSIRATENAIIRKHFGENAPTVEELQKNIHMLFLNVHQIWDNNRPVPPSVLYMGALHVKKPKPIPENFKKYLDASKNGVIYVSLGSKFLFSDLPDEDVRVFMKVFADIPYDVLLKWNGGDLPNKPPNVRLEKWIPQNDILHHPKIKAFVTQGGLQSTDEAIAANVPLIGFPVIGDQWYNAQKYEQFGIGIELDIKNVQEENLRNAILSVASEKSYRENITRLSEVMREQRQGGLEKAVYWTEYVATRGALHLRSPLADAPLVDYFMLDVIAAAFASVLIAITVILVLIGGIFKSFRRETHVKVKRN